MILRREKIEKVYNDLFTVVDTEVTYHYDNNEEFKDHKIELEKQGFELELKTDINVGSSDSDLFVVAGYYTKHEVLSKK